MPATYRGISDEIFKVARLGSGWCVGMDTMDLDEYHELIGRRKSAGAYAKAMGDSFQARVALWCLEAQTQGVAVIHQTYPAVRVTGKDKDGPICRFVGPGPCDFVGVAGDRVVAFEAKSVAAGNFRVSEHNRHQWQFMYDCRRQQPSGVIGYLIEHRKQGLVCWYNLAGDDYNPAQADIQRVCSIKDIVGSFWSRSSP